MRIKEHVLATIQRRARASAEIAASLVLHPDCMNGDSQREKAYRVAIQYLKEKEEDCKKPEGVSYSSRQTIALQVLVECYEESEGEMKQTYASKIAGKLIETEEFYLMLIPSEIKDVAFQIAIKYLEEQRNA